MCSVLCALWLLFLGLALPPIIFAIAALARSWKERPEAPFYRSRFVGILYLTPTCIRALGTCARIKRLATQSSERIGERLARFPFPDGEARPSKDQYSSWPEQAALLSAGKLKELTQLQENLRERLGPPQSEIRNSDRDNPKNPPFIVERTVWILALAGVLLLIVAFALWEFAKRAEQCKPLPPIVPCSSKPCVKHAELSTDLIFDYNFPISDKDSWRSQLYHDKAVNAIRDLFAGFGGITIRTITAHTDPIGETKENQKLGKRRAAAVASLISEIEKQPGQNITFEEQKSPQLDTTPSGPSPEEAPFWKFCFNRYFLSQRENERPLQDLASRFNDDHRVPCHRATVNDVYPACARLNIPIGRQRPRAGYAQAAENLRLMTECLAPMRHVAITFEYERQLPTPSAQTSDPAKGHAQ